MHSPGAQVSKCVHPAAKLCTPGAGCTLNFEYWHAIGQRGTSDFTNDLRNQCCQLVGLLETELMGCSMYARKGHTRFLTMFYLNLDYFNRLLLFFKTAHYSLQEISSKLRKLVNYCWMVNVLLKQNVHSHKCGFYVVGETF